jgi:hypothetical protein
MVRRSRRFEVFTCDRGRRVLDVDRDPLLLIAAILQEVVESGFWRELDKFPTDAIAQALPHLSVPRSARRLLEIWVEERADGRTPA